MGGVQRSRSRTQETGTHACLPRDPRRRTTPWERTAVQPSLIRPKLREKQLPEGAPDTRSIRPRPLLDGRGLLEAPRAIPARGVDPRQGRRRRKPAAEGGGDHGDEDVGQRACEERQGTADPLLPDLRGKCRNQVRALTKARCAKRNQKERPLGNCGRGRYRDFVLTSYKTLKAAAPELPILVREANGVGAKMYARFDLGVEKSVSLDGLDKKEVAIALQNLLEQGKHLPKSVNGTA
eukprot:scaffold1681_cov332-Pavlova_lutheri.AAC.15